MDLEHYEHCDRRQDGPGIEGVSEIDLLIPLDPETQERRLLRKLDQRILPILCLLYLFAYLDRSNLGNARLQGLPQDVLGGDPTGVLFNWVNSAFFFTYILLQIPFTVLSKYYNPRIWIGCSAILWGICSTSMAVAQNFTGLMIARLGLGTFEAAFGGAVALYFSFYYTKAEYGTRIAYWFGFATVAGAFGGLLAYGIQHIKVSIANWRLLFILEGAPTILLGVLCVFMLPGRPESTPFLTTAERKIAINRMNRGTSGDFGAVVRQSHVIAAFQDWRIYVGGVIYFGLNCALASLSAFLPTIIATMGHTNAMAQLMTVPPYAMAGCVLIATSYCSDRLQIRGPLLICTSTIGGLGYMILLGTTHRQDVRYGATFLITSGTYASIGLTIAWFNHNLGSETKRATGIPLYGAIGQCGSILGSHLYPLTEGPAYTNGFTVSAFLLFLAALCALLLSISFRLDNMQRDEKYGKPDPNDMVDTSELADKAPAFRYIM
ncbi:major facilitator superfamily domain-containing protein [Suillus paluster]|uniref:major facilitator superfamily domain-containing protein n=1 Tax=Suillus paluster TaxID=48578 RepID=UPI001B86B30B|nr:major facilitator superfamily domain-containing protein [Suillus paluster]KAG1736129.1 major facilitator superfamily domain-containing protein [Suillus paluster]